MRPHILVRLTSFLGAEDFSLFFEKCVHSWLWDMKGCGNEVIFLSIVLLEIRAWWKEMNDENWDGGDAFSLGCNVKVGYIKPYFSSFPYRLLPGRWRMKTKPHFITILSCIITSQPILVRFWTYLGTWEERRLTRSSLRKTLLSWGVWS